ncbi:hypothetical protein ANCCAN_18767 [Ancylostoma caninum]|uniref:Uncharacterized protein n=1 Tax=Ancylostoma caninum TaxID=29170 RepID=A0A368FT15_ANCCA|nr:hypothetical protein ANCCAN_18767 [Ancylostoma caninum]
MSATPCSLGKRNVTRIFASAIGVQPYQEETVWICWKQAVH